MSALEKGLRVVDGVAAPPAESRADCGGGSGSANPGFNVFFEGPLFLPPFNLFSSLFAARQRIQYVVCIYR